MRKVYGKIIIIALVVFLWLDSSSMVLASVPYKTFTEDHNRRLIHTQDAYYPAGLIEKVGETELSGPSDIFIDNGDRIYVADTNNGRIVITNKAGQPTGIVGEGTLKKPTGVFVDEQGNIYAADSGLGQVVKFDRQGQVTQTFNRPDSPLYGKNSPYKPVKVTVDKRGNVYIISEGTANGVVQMSTYGDFIGYFGSNDTEVSLRIMLEHLVLTDSQQAKISKNAPHSPTNSTVDNRGLIYTVTQGVEGKSLKKFNISGFNLLPEDMSFLPLYTDLTISRNGNIYGLDQTGYIVEFDSEGHMLFLFGAPDDGKSRVGLFKYASGIAVDSNENIYVVDRESNHVQIFEPTDFTANVHEALVLYKEGFYVKSQDPWKRVLQKNNLFDLAHKGLGDALFKQQVYKGALEEYVVANDKSSYSNTFWELRNAWLQRNLMNVFLILIGVWLALFVLKQIHRRTKVFAIFVRSIQRILAIRFINQVLFIFNFVKHPLDSFYGIKDENRVSIASATFLYVLFFAEYIFSLYYTGFIFNNVEPSSLMITKEVAKILVPFALWVIANYMISTINDGEGKFVEVYQGTIYSMAPYLLFSPLIVIFSNVLTFNDAFVYSFTNNMMVVWCIVLLFLMVKEIHDYTIRETIRNIFITLFGMLILSIIAFIVYVLLDQVIDFVYSVIREMMVRAEL